MSSDDRANPLDLTHFQLIGAMIGAVVPAGWAAWKATTTSDRINKQIQPNGDGETRTLRELITEILHMNNRFADQLRDHDARQREVAEHVVRVERKLDDHLAWDTTRGRNDAD